MKLSGLGKSRACGNQKEGPYKQLSLNLLRHRGAGVGRIASPARDVGGLKFQMPAAFAQPRFAVMAATAL